MTVSELQRFVKHPLIIANIEGGKLACADTQNRTLFRIFADLVTFFKRLFLGCDRKNATRMTLFLFLSCTCTCTLVSLI